MDKEGDQKSADGAQTACSSIGERRIELGVNSIYNYAIDIVTVPPLKENHDHRHILVGVTESPCIRRTACIIWG
jgi:hypothetical protein